MLTIPGEIPLATRMTYKELRQEIAVMLYEKEKLALGQASQFAGMSQMQFQNLIASRHIPIHYDIEELEQDFETIIESRSFID
ncbi:MAG: UPF0175 family protein [candidate division KSB1 bacterium]|nr:UPF0175 family protein [candidate division KSB1 bacterium]